ncbi:hypothetical protein FRC12_014093, partial [Ceratobasidium sp. 428]
MTVLEVISGKTPFYEIKNEPAVTGGQQGDILWELLTQCWSDNPLSRPTASNFRIQIGAITQEGLRDCDRDKQRNHEAHSQRAVEQTAEVNQHGGVVVVTHAQANKLANIEISESLRYSDQEAGVEPHDTAGAVLGNTVRETSYMADAGPLKERGEQRAG